MVAVAFPQFSDVPMSAGKLGFGLMRLPLTDLADEAAIDMPQLEQMVDRFMEHGFTYFDTAWMYQNFASETVAKTALVDRYPRDSFALATKLHHEFFLNLQDCDRIFDAQLENTGAGYFDFYLLHGIGSMSYRKYESVGCFEWLAEKKRQGLVRHAGISFHDTADVLDRILTDHPEMEFVQLQLNYLDWDSEWIQSRACYEVACAHGKPVIVMEPVKGGTLADVPPQAEALFHQANSQLSVSSWAIRFTATLPNVMVVLSGMSSLAQMDDNISYMERFEPLTPEEQQLCFDAARIINEQIAIPCTACSYCAPGCPQDIAIPQYFSLYNDIMREDMDRKGWTASFTSYNVLAEKFGRADECIACGACEDMCPQHLPIIEHLKAVSERFDNQG